VLPAKPANPSFIFWGRISQEKGLDRAIRLFAKVHKRYPIARFWVVGPDAGAQHAAQALCVSLGLKNAVIFMGNATLDEIVGYALPASFYLQTSHFEGMAMSVVEAMQLGLVPVVTPVGEIAHYCQDGQNAVIIGADQQAVEDVISLLVAGERYQAMRANAIATWAHQPLYRDSVLSACENALRGRHAT
jgi:glycosyltransferase involved in cell wall biosynthesis